MCGTVSTVCLLNTGRLSLKKLSDHPAEKNRGNGFLIIDGLGSPAEARSD